MERQFKLECFSAEKLKYLYPHQIIAKLDYFVAAIPVDLSSPVEKPGGLEKQLEALSPVLDHIESRLGEGHTLRSASPLTKLEQDYLSFLVLAARRAAYRLLESQPETPLGFHPGRREFLSNLFLASWLDQTEGGTIDVEWTKLD